MNGSFGRWLLDLENIPEGAGDLHLAWEHPWPAWLWLVLLIGAAALAAWSYAPPTGHRAVRAVLAVVRFTVFLLVLIFIGGPMVELPRERLERDWVLTLADRSASMSIADVAEGGGRITREEQLRGIIDANHEVWAALSEQRQVRWLGFHSATFSLTSEPAGADGPGSAHTSVDLGEATGDRTNLAGALEQALQRAAGRPVSGILLLSDGRTSDPPGRALRRRLQAQAVGVYAVPLGSPESSGDVAVRRVDAPHRAFVGDKIPVQVEVDRVGTAAEELSGVVKLIDELTERTLDRIEVSAATTRQPITLTAEPALAGEARWTVVFEPDGPDLIPANNRKSVLIELVDRPLRVLYVDGYPRWEYRYLKNLLIREQSIECSVMLLSADRDFAQEGDRPITRLPRSAEELAGYDVVVLGDVPGSYFTPEQLVMIREHVADRGAGLLWIGGERYTPDSYAGTVLADLLPMRGSLTLAPIGQPVNMEPTDAAERLGVLQLVIGQRIGWPQELSDPSYGWSQLYYAQRIEPERLKPTAEVLARTVAPIDGSHLPLAMHMRYGAGRSLYVATDEIWRWRYGRGERLPDQFWIQMIRMLGRASLLRAGEHAALEVSPRRVEVGQPLRVELRLLDAQLVETERATIAAVLETESGRKLADLELRRLPSSEDRFSATCVPDTAGSLRVRVSEPALAEPGLVMPVEVYASDDELRRPETDHPLLERLALETGGQVLAPEDLADLPELLPNRAVRTLDPLREPIWDTSLAFTLVLLMLTAEWIGRRIIRLV
jgi:uncharacterized membrane protein